MKEIRLVISDKKEFMSRDESKLIGDFRISGLSKFQFKECETYILNLILLHEDFFSIDTLVEEIQAVVTENYEIDYRNESKSLAQLEYSYIQNSEARMRKKDYLISDSRTSIKLLIGNLPEEIKSVVT